jgi:hypothetical protein
MNHAAKPVPAHPHPTGPTPTPAESARQQQEQAESREVAGRHKNDGQKDHKGAR